MIRNIRNTFSLGASLACAAAALLVVPAAARAQRVTASFHTSAAPVAPAVAMQPVAAKSAGTATLFSLLITGGGQLYNEETTKGIVMLGAGLVFAGMAVDGVDEYDCDPDEQCMPWLLPVGLGGALLVKIWSIADAAIGAGRWNASHQIASVTLHPTVAVTPTGNNKSVRLGVRGTF